VQADAQWFKNVKILNK